MNHYSPTVEQLIQARMATGKYASQDELLVAALEALEEEEELQITADDLKAIDQGEEGTPLHLAFDEIRRSNNLPPRPQS